MSTSPKPNSKNEKWALFGAELRKHRKKEKMIQDDLAEATQFSRSLLSFTERGERNPSHNLAQRCDAALGANGELVRYWTYMTHAASPRWFRDWLEIEPAAHTLHTWQPLLVPGLLQTEEYARAVLRGKPGVTDDEVERLVAARMARQAIFARVGPPMLRVVLDEGVLYRPIGGKEVMHDQIERMLIGFASPKIAIQVLPLALGVTTGVLGGFVIAQIQGSADIVYLESALNGQVTNRSEDVEAIQATYDTIRAEAQSQHVSIDVIREAAKTWI
ncbi:helix-turn-helix domain-containing protein [Streptosporangium sp. V21-05]|uniref:helix-turn-helix domain-containing protein n=1 Tax=Streptosporangium sp. V21-05 TaxID=3446115 RepID=UPI003F53C2BD